MKILVINGPNINMLGIREPQVYGNKDYSDLLSAVSKEAKKLKVKADICQSNVEGELVTFIQNARGVYDGIVINPGAYTHYSIAILDAIKSAGLPAVEVHITNIHAREGREKSVTGAGCAGIISGFGIDGYRYALMALSDYIKNHAAER